MPQAIEWLLATPRTSPRLPVISPAAVSVMSLPYSRRSPEIVGPAGSMVQYAEGPCSCGCRSWAGASAIAFTARRGRIASWPRSTTAMSLVGQPIGSARVAAERERRVRPAEAEAVRQHRIQTGIVDARGRDLLGPEFGIEIGDVGRS